MTDIATSEVDFGHAETDAAMIAAGVSPIERPPTDYFAFDVHDRVDLDGGQWIEIKAMNEGQRRKYLAQINRDVIIHRQTGDAKMKIDSGSERHALLTESVVNWHLLRNGSPLTFTRQALEELLVLAPPKMLDKVEQAVRKLNPWLVAETMTVEAIDEEIVRLKEQREVLVQEQQGKASF